jgi:hypothetical protein
MTDQVEKHGTGHGAEHSAGATGTSATVTTRKTTIKQRGASASPAPASTTQPTIEKVDPDVAKVGDEIIITGVNFGTEVGSVVIGGVIAGVVMNEDTEQSPIQSAPAWSDTEVTVVVPEVNILKYAGQGMARHHAILTTGDPDTPLTSAPFQFIVVA